jgi:murein DD-endopeptidase MepM/ murein hydrolase activator NlpD
MKKQRNPFLFTLFFLLTAAPAFAENPLRLEILPKAAKQGDVCLVRVAGQKNLKNLEGEFQRVRISMNPDSAGKAHEGLLAVDLDTKPGKYQVKVRATDQGGKGLAGASSLEIKKVSFSTQTLSLPPSMVDLDAKTLERVNGETKRVEALFQRARKDRLWKGRFLRPVQGEISTPFGLRRVINRQNKSPHSGVDLRADEGTPILASNSGSVVLVDDFFFSGKSVILDHGQGIYSMYFHLSEILVREGEKISKGDVLGQVGSTGRSTGPHLHWGVRVHGAKVDPFSLIRATETMRH